MQSLLVKEFRFQENPENSTNFQCGLCLEPCLAGENLYGHAGNGNLHPVHQNCFLEFLAYQLANNQPPYCISCRQPLNATHLELPKEPETKKEKRLLEETIQSIKLAMPTIVSSAIAGIALIFFTKTGLTGIVSTVTATSLIVLGAGIPNVQKHNVTGAAIITAAVAAAALIITISAGIALGGPRIKTSMLAEAVAPLAGATAIATGAIAEAELDTRTLGILAIGIAIVAAITEPGEGVATPKSMLTTAAIPLITELGVLGAAKSVKRTAIAVRDIFATKFFFA